MQGRLDFIDISKGIAIISIVWVHTLKAYGADMLNYGILTQLLLAVSYVPLFFIVSGALAAKMFESKQMTVYAKLCKCVHTILKPFYMLSILFLLFHVAAGVFFQGYRSFAEMVTSLLFLNIDDSLPSGVLYYLFVLFLSTVIVTIWKNVLDFNEYFLFALAIVLAYFSPHLTTITFFSVNRFSSNFIFYVFGVIYSIQILNKKVSIFIFAMYTIAFAILFYIFKVAHIFPQTVLLEKTISLLGFMLLINTLKLASPVSNIIPLSILRILGISSFAIYVFHMPSFRLIQPLITRIRTDDPNIAMGLWLSLGILIPIFIERLLFFTPGFYKLIFSRPPPPTEVRSNTC